MRHGTFSHLRVVWCAVLRAHWCPVVNCSAIVRVVLLGSLAIVGMETNVGTATTSSIRRIPPLLLQQPLHPPLSLHLSLCSIVMSILTPIFQSNNDG
jgi:hypothetical protein